MSEADEKVLRELRQIAQRLNIVEAKHDLALNLLMDDVQTVDVAAMYWLATVPPANRLPA